MKRFVRRLIGLFAAVLLLSVGGTAVAQPQTLDSGVEIAYGQKITFRLIGQFADEVEQIELFINTARAATPLSVAVRFSQDETQLMAGYDLDPTLAALDPFAEVTYWWELTTTDGEIFSVPESRFIYEDDRFDWRVLSEEDITVHWTGNDDVLGRLAWEIAVNSRQILDRILPPTAVSPLNLYIYPSTADLRAGLRLAGRDWQDEHTDPTLGVLLVTAVNLLTAEADLSQSIPHEMAHLRLVQSAPAVPLPRWYEEGLALLVEENNGEREELVETAVASDTALTLLTLCTNFPEETPEQELALAQAVSLLGYIQAQFGDQALRQLGAVYLSGADCEAGLSQTLDMSLAELNADWLAAQTPQPAWLTFLSQNSIWVLLLLASFGFLALVLRK
jgi:hypothetical protein